MRDGSRPKMYKSLRVSQSTGRSPALVETVSQNLTQATMPTFTCSQAGTTTYMPALQTETLPLASTLTQSQSQVQAQSHNIESHKHIQSHPRSLIHAQTLTVTHGEIHNCPQSPTLVQVAPRVLSQALVYSHAQMLPQSHVSIHSEVDTSSRVQSLSRVQSHSHVHTQSQVLTPTQVHTQTQGSTQIHSVSPVCTQLQTNLPLSPQTQTQSQIYTHSQSQVHTKVPTPQILTQSLIHTQPRTHTQTHIHIQPQVHAHAQVHAQAHTHMHSNSQVQVQPASSIETHIPVQSQLQPLPIQAHLPTLSQVTLSSTLPDLVDTSQIENASQKDSEGLEEVHIPISRHHNSSASLQDHSSSVTMNDVLSTNSHTQLMHTLTAFPLADTLNTSITLQQNSAILSPTLTQSLTQSQILDDLSVDRVLMPSRSDLGQTVATEEPSVGISGLPTIQGQENFTGCPEQPSPSSLVSSVKESEVSKSMDATHLCTSQINSQQMGTPQLSSLHLLAEDGVSAPLPEKASPASTTTSTLIASNRMLNKLLDTNKPHIPSQVTKAAEIAHLVPNPTARLPLSSFTRSGEQEDGTEITYTVSSCGSSSLTTLTRSCMASMCTVTASVRGASGEIGVKASSSSSDDSIFGLPSTFPAPSATLVVPTSVSHGQIISQRQMDDVQQALMNSESTANIGEQQLEGLSTDGLRLYPQTSNVSQIVPVTSCSLSNINNLAITLQSDKTLKKTSSSNFQPCNVTKPFSLLGVPEGLNKGGTSLDPNSRFQNSTCTKTGLITSTDPMFTSVAVTSGCSSPTSLGTVIPTRSGTTSHDGLGRVKAASSDTRVTHQTLADLLSRSSASDGVTGSGGTGMSLMGLSDSRLPHTSDVLLSELHRSDESDLSLGATLSSNAGEGIHNASGLVTEASLVTGMGGDSTPLQELPSPPLSSFSLPNITADFMVNEVSGSKNCHPSQAQLSALLSNLPTSDFDRFLDNSNTSMCIDISLSDSEVSLNAESSFTISPGKSHLNRKSLSTTASELTFTSALKAVTTKSSSEEVKLLSDPEPPSKLLNDEQPAVIQEPSKCLPVKVNSVLSGTNTLSGQVALYPSIGKAETLSANISKPNAQIQNKSPLNQKEKRKDMLRKNQLLVQQVACYKCRLCSFLNQDRIEMVIHMREHHSQYYSDTEESEDEVGQRTPSKKVKVLVPQNECVLSEGTFSNHEPKKSAKVNRESSQNDKTKQESVKEKSHLVKIKSEEVSGKGSMHIKSEPRDVGEFEGCLIDKYDEEDELEEDSAGLTIELGESGGNTADSDLEYADEDDDISYSPETSESATNAVKGGSMQTGQSPSSKNNVAIKRKNAKKSSDDTASIRCEVNGCGVRMKSETNITYHRKCHVNSMLQCQECLSTKFQGWRDLALHLWRHHLIDMELHKCDKCDYKSYSYSKLMNVHHKIHSDERPSLCDICGKRFKTPKQLRNHKTLHMKKTEAPQHQCEICHRPFSDKRMLRNHQESVHKKVKPFLCNYCGYSTASRSTLKMHMRQHTGEKPFACEKCKYRTSDHNSLRRHKMQHSGVRPYRCPYCDYASIQSTTFKVHLKDKHPGLAQMDGIMFTCGVCSFKTVKRDNFLAHVAEHSRGESRKQMQPVSPASASKIEEPQGIFGDLTPSAPHVVNIDVESGTVTVESPQDSDFLSSVHVQAPVPGQVIMAGDKYIYAAVDSSILSQVRSGERIVQLAQDVVGVPLSLPLETSTASPLQGLVYVATTTSQGAQ